MDTIQARETELDLVDTINRMGTCVVIQDIRGMDACVRDLVGEILRLRKEETATTALIGELVEPWPVDRAGQCLWCGRYLIQNIDNHAEDCAYVAGKKRC